jgi:hypothetical protein
MALRAALLSKSTLRYKSARFREVHGLQSHVSMRVLPKEIHNDPMSSIVLHPEGPAAPAITVFRLCT